MIVPMKKISLFIKGDQKEKTLETLRRLGILQIEISEGCGERLAELSDRIVLLENALYLIGKQKGVPQKEASPERALEIAQRVVALAEEKKDCVAGHALLCAELERIAALGDFDPHSLDALAQSGIALSLYEMPRAEYKRIGNGVRTLALDKGKKSVVFLALAAKEEGGEEQLALLRPYRIALPERPVAELRREQEALGEKIRVIDEEIRSCAECMQALKAAIRHCEQELEFETYATGMPTQDLSAGDSKPFSVAYFKGYVEAERVDTLRRTARENAWGLLVEEPTAEDNVPTKLKNNRFVSLIYPITDFLGTVPGYFEYDISGWFLTFILIFFGIIFGDGGYGLIVCAIAAALIVKTRAAKKEIPAAFLLMGLLGLSTVLWGTLTCTWFGLSAQQLPVWLRRLSVPVISNVYADTLWYPFWTYGTAGLTTAQNTQILCFTLALVQLSVAHFMGVARNRRSPKLLGDVGAILQLLGMYYLVLSLVVNPTVFTFGLVIAGVPVGTVAIALIGVGFVLSFTFSNYEGSVVGSVLASLKNIVSVLLGVVNVFSDIVSYIRLWAVGLAGAAISATVNDLVSPFLGHLMFVALAIVLLVFGHGLNMILNVLSVIVHGIRLNTLEFSSHLDMSWSGRKFKPFQE